MSRKRNDDTGSSPESSTQGSEPLGSETLHRLTSESAAPAASSGDATVERIRKRAQRRPAASAGLIGFEAPLADGTGAPPAPSRRTPRGTGGRKRRHVATGARAVMAGVSASSAFIVMGQLVMNEQRATAALKKTKPSGTDATQSAGGTTASVAAGAAPADTTTTGAPGWSANPAAAPPGTVPAGATASTVAGAPAGVAAPGAPSAGGQPASAGGGAVAMGGQTAAGMPTTNAQAVPE